MSYGEQLARQAGIDVAEEHRVFFVQVFSWLGFGLLITGVTAHIFHQRGGTDWLLEHWLVYLGLFAFEIALVFVLAGLVMELPLPVVATTFVGYALLNGLTLSPLLAIYTPDSVARVFGYTAVMFGAMAGYGFYTRRDLTRWGPLLFMGLVGIIFAMVVNFFAQSGTADYLISVIAVALFSALTAYDIQFLKETNVLGNMGTAEDVKEAIRGALHLYLDFVNLFLHMLRLFGETVADA